MALSTDLNDNVEEEVVVVSTPDSCGQNPATEEMLSTAELQQSDEDIVEQSLKAEACSAISIAKETVLDVDTDVLYQITCGDSKADLVWKKFVCPGINVKCVQFNNHLISPKEFVYLAGKSTLKDWKRAIRLNGTMIRKIMDSGELDFYEHSKLCSNTCRSTKIDLVGTRASLSSQASTETLQTPSTAEVNGSVATFSTETSEDGTEWVTAVREDTLTFWRGLKDAGLLEDIMDDLQKEIEEDLKGLQERIQEPPIQVKDAALLNNIVQNFGMLDLVKKVLSSHKSEMDRCREQYTQSLVALERQCDDHRKRAKELKSKSQHLNNVLMNLTPISTPSAPKRPCLTRAVSGPAAVMTAPAQPAQFTLPITQLTGISLDKILSVIGGVAPTHSPLSYTVLTSPAGAELQHDASALTMLNSDGTAGPAIVKVISPFQLVTLPTLQNLSSSAGGSTIMVPVSTAMETVLTQAEEPEASTEL